MVDKEGSSQFPEGIGVFHHVNVNQVREILREGRNEGSVILASGQRLRMSKIGWRNLLAVSRT
jgi:hypothetical protein